MINRKILQCILNYSNSSLEETYFDPLLSKKTASDISKNICKSLKDTTDFENSLLKKEIRQSIFTLIKQLCKTNDDFTNENLIGKNDVLIKHFYNKKESNQIYRREKLQEISFDFVQFIDFTDVQNNEMDINDINLGVALINIRTPFCDAALNDIVKRCLNIRGELNESTYEFLKRVWENEELIIPIELYDVVTSKMISLIEIKLLGIAKLLITISTDYDINEILTEYFPNWNILLMLFSKSSIHFQNFFYILSDILIKSRFNKKIQNLISYILEDIKCVCTSKRIMLLYPLRLNNIIIYLKTNPDNIKNAVLLYDHTINLIYKLYSSSYFDFVFVMSHHYEWLKYFFTYLDTVNS